MVLSLHSEIFLLANIPDRALFGHQALAGFSPPTCDGVVNLSREMAPTSGESEFVKLAKSCQGLPSHLDQQRRV
jgi:hypothetical protein